MLVVSVRAGLDPRKLTRASEQLREVGRRLVACYLRRTEAVGLSDRKEHYLTSLRVLMIPGKSFFCSF